MSEIKQLSLRIFVDAKTTYFEAKIQRVVNFNEFSAAIVPDYIGERDQKYLEAKTALRFINMLMRINMLVLINADRKALLQSAINDNNLQFLHGGIF